MSLKIEQEIKLDSDPCVVAWDNKLFVGTEDGSIKCYDEKLTIEASWSAHAVQPFAIAAGRGNVYSTSNDGGVKVWSYDGTKVTELPHLGVDIGTLHLDGDTLYTGDEQGNVLVYVDNKEKARYNLLEEVKDIATIGNLLITVRDLDITVTEIKPGDSTTRYTTVHTMEGRAPLRVAGTKLVAMARGGNDIQLLDMAAGTKFKKFCEVKASDMIVTSMSIREDFVWTAGWDGTVRRWKISKDLLEPMEELKVGGCINCLVPSSADCAYAGLTGGRLIRIAKA